MKTIKLLFAFLLISIVGIQAQTTSGEPTYYKITFLEINEFQLKETIPACEELFGTYAQSKENVDVLYFDSERTITKEELRKKLDEHNINFEFKLTIANDERE